MRFLVFILLSMFIGSASAQYNSLIDENKHWIIKNVFTDLLLVPPPTVTYYFAYFNGDTIISSTTYKRLHHQQFYNSEWYSTGNQVINDTLQQPNLVAFIREDTITKKVYQIANNFTFPQEDLLLDYSLSVGDTLKNVFTANFGYGNGEIDSITNLILANGDTCNVLHFDYQFIPVGSLEANFMIEGIGAPGGIYNPFYYLGLSGVQNETTIVCYSENGIDLFGSCSYPNYYTSVQDINNSTNINIHPNPTSRQLTITIKETVNNASVSIRNNLGQLILSERFDGKEVQLNLDVPKGIYFLQLAINGEIITKKIIKQ